LQLKHLKSILRTNGLRILSHAEKCYLDCKNSALNPEPQFKKIASLKYKIEDVFAIFQEGTGEFVEYFWKEIKNQNLDYAREDRLGKILKHGKIKSIIEFDYVKDSIVAAEKENTITNMEAKILSEMLITFENKKRK
jgi:hypothetical protein